MNDSVINWPDKKHSDIWLLYILAFFIPYSQSFPLINIAGRKLNIGFDTIIITIIIALYVTRTLLLKKNIIVLDKALKWLLIWWLWNLCVLAVSVLQLSGSQQSDVIIVFLRCIQYIPVYFIILNINVPQKQLENILLVCFGAAILMSIVNLYDYFIIGVDYEKIRGTGLAVKNWYIEDAHTNYNVSGTYLACVLLLITPFILLNKNKFKKVFGGIITLLILLGIWVTSSRSSLFAVVVGFIILCSTYFKKFIPYIVCIFVLVAFVSIWYLNDTHLINNLQDARDLFYGLPSFLNAVFTSKEISSSPISDVQRLFVWAESINFYMQSPIWGHGFQMTRWSKGPYEFYTAESYYLETLADSGIIGFILLFIFLTVQFRSSMKLYYLAKECDFIRQFCIGYQAFFIGLAVVNISGGMFMSQKIFGIFILISALVSNQLYKYKKIAIFYNLRSSRI